MILSLVVLSVAGLCVAFYAYVTENRIKNDPTYKPACDLSDRISCTRVMNSKYASMFYVSNSMLGILFYGTVLVLAFLDQPYWIFLLSIAACASSLFFWLSTLFQN